MHPSLHPRTLRSCLLFIPRHPFPSLPFPIFIHGQVVSALRWKAWSKCTTTGLNRSRDPKKQPTAIIGQVLGKKTHTHIHTLFLTLADTHSLFTYMATTSTYLPLHYLHIFLYTYTLSYTHPPINIFPLPSPTNTPQH